MNGRLGMHGVQCGARVQMVIVDLTRGLGEFVEGTGGGSFRQFGGVGPGVPAPKFGQAVGLCQTSLFRQTPFWWRSALIGESPCRIGGIRSMGVTPSCVEGGFSSGSAGRIGWAKG
jgi:hypothetical protein